MPRIINFDQDGRGRVRRICVGWETDGGVDRVAVLTFTGDGYDVRRFIKDESGEFVERVEPLFGVNPYQRPTPPARC